MRGNYSEYQRAKRLRKLNTLLRSPKAQKSIRTLSRCFHARARALCLCMSRTRVQHGNLQHGNLSLCNSLRQLQMPCYASRRLFVCSRHLTPSVVHVQGIAGHGPSSAGSACPLPGLDHPGHK